MKYYNYTKTCRKKTGLSQNEVAFLLGLKSSHFIVHTELGNENPTLSRLLLYHILYDKQVDDLYPELLEKLALEIFSRIAFLSKQLEKKNQTDIVKRKINYLDSIATKIADKYKGV